MNKRDDLKTEKILEVRHGKSVDVYAFDELTKMVLAGLILECTRHICFETSNRTRRTLSYYLKSKVK